ncbi:MAG: hypothetical protein ACREVC_12155 [Burkholderiales bacterium]
MSKRRRKTSKPKPFWERGYRGHAYWLGKRKLGKVTLVETGRYDWEAAGRNGRCETLGQARAAVELAIALCDRQLPLFE